MIDEDKQFKKWHLVLFGIIILIFIILKLSNIFYWPKAKVEIGGQTIKVLVADTVSHQTKGWSGAGDMGSVQGMWHKFNSRAYHMMVMRDMEFSLDIVWIDNGMIVDIAPNLPPEKNKTEEELTLYRPRLPANNVLELPAGFTADNGIKIGDRVKFIEP